jgi:hypothetical protein
VIRGGRKVKGIIHPNVAISLAHIPLQVLHTAQVKLGNLRLNSRRKRSYICNKNGSSSCSSRGKLLQDRLWGMIGKQSSELGGKGSRNVVRS